MARYFSLSVLLMAAAMALCVSLLSRCSHSAEPLERYVERALFSLPVFYEDRLPGGVAGHSVEKQVQLRTIAREVARVSASAPLPPRQWAALLITVGYHESAYSLRIFAGQCKKWECDRGRARSAWQVQRNQITEPYWEKLWGLDNTGSQVDAAHAMLRRQMQCGKTVEGILTAYQGKRCGLDYPGIRSRMDTYRRLRP